ncbi:MAG TPA: sigma-70 family RNA polymerase sigma factor [Candidatus Methylacidiphilales bacterium]
MDSGTNEADVLAMERLQQGDDLALNEIMGRWKVPLASYLLRQLGSQEDALDLAMETFVRVYESRHRYAPSARFARWLFTIATNLARNHVRWRQRHPEVPFETDEDDKSSSLDRVVDDAPSASGQLDGKERARAVRQAIAGLPADLRTAILLFEYEDFSHAEIAAVEGCSVKAVETRLYRARQALEQKLAKWMELQR